MVRKENESKFIFGTLGLFFGGFILLLSILFLWIGFEINSWGWMGIEVIGTGFDSTLLAIPILIIGIIGLTIGLPSFLVSALNLIKSLEKND